MWVCLFRFPLSPWKGRQGRVIETDCKRGRRARHKTSKTQTDPWWNLSLSTTDVCHKRGWHETSKTQTDPWWKDLFPPQTFATRKAKRKQTPDKNLSLSTPDVCHSVDTIEVLQVDGASGGEGGGDGDAEPSIAVQQHRVTAIQLQPLENTHQSPSHYLPDFLLQGCVFLNHYHLSFDLSLN